LDLVFQNEQDRSLFNTQKLLTKKYGSVGAKIIRRRLDDLSKVLTLSEMKILPGRCHELVHRKWELSLDLEQPNRLIFEPVEDPVPVKADGGLDWSRIHGVRIKGIEDTHE
jgi:proteic killer suppression protein